MKKLILLLILVFSTTAQAGETYKDQMLLKAEQELEKYKKDCYKNEAFPEDFDNYSMYNDDIKEGDYRYHQCIKKIIIQKINKMAASDDAKKMIADLDKIQEGTSDFYWVLFNRQDNGTIGRGMNDAVLGRRFENILEDIVHYQVIYENN